MNFPTLRNHFYVDKSADYIEATVVFYLDF